MRIVYFTHSLQSCWNHGNAHFVRGVLSELIARGHEVIAYEPAGSWSLTNLIDDHGEAALGLGLPLTRQFVEAHGGTVDLQSRKGEGTVVTIALPRRS